MQISVGCPIEESMSILFTLMRILFLLVHFLSARPGTSSLVDSDPSDYSSPPEHANALSHTAEAPIRGETPARDLASSWCSAYTSSDPKRLAALETREVQIVDRFGDLHRLIGLKAREHFWEDGFEVTSRKDFRPKCTVRHVRLIGLNAAIAQVVVSYDEGIALKDDDQIPPFSEVHTLVLVNVENTWLISAQDIVHQNSRE
jgi:hypothetical protein